MNKIEKQYLDSVRLAIHGQPVPALPKEVLSLAKKQSTSGIISDDRQFLTNIRILHKLQREMADRLLAEFESRSIDALIVKGLSIAQLYPDPNKREYGDIDILVRESQFAQAKEVVEAVLGVAPDEESVHHAHYKKLPMIVELHPGVQCGSIYFGRMDNYDEDLFFGTAIDHNLEPTLNAFYVFMHLYTHFISGGIGVRHLCDWALALEAEGVDKGRLITMLPDRHAVFYWKMLGWCLVEYLGLSSEKMPLYDRKMRCRARMAMRYIFRVGNFGKNRTVKSGCYIRRFISERIDYILFATMVFGKDCKVWWSKFSRLFRSYRLEAHED